MLKTTRHCKDVRSLVSRKFAKCVFSVRRFDPFPFVRTCKEYYISALYVLGRSRVNQGIYSSVIYRVKSDSQKSILKQKFVL